MKTGEPSVTAQRVAAHRLGFDRLATPYGDPAAEDRLAADVAVGVGVRSDGPMVRYLAARTAFFDREVTTAIDGGVTQVVVAAAGYDGRALRYAKPGVRWFEVDHPDTQRDKRARLDRLGLAADRVSFVPVDFGTDEVGPGLIGAGLDPGVPSLLLCEGIAVYLDEPVLASLLRALRAVAAAGSELVISFSVSSDAPELAARRASFQARMAAVGEPAGTVLTAAGAEALLADAGWRVAATERARHAGFVTAVPA